MVFLIDASEDTTEDDFDKTKQYIRDMISKLDILEDKTRVGVLTIPQGNDDPIFLDDHYDRALLLAAIDSDVQYLGGSFEYNFADSLRIARERMFSLNNGHRTGIPQVLFIVTNDKMDLGDFAFEVEELKADYVTIMMLVYGDTVNKDTMVDTLRDIVSSPQDENYYIVTSSRSLDDSMVLKTRTRLCEHIPRKSQLHYSKMRVYCCLSYCYRSWRCASNL